MSGPSFWAPYFASFTDRPECVLDAAALPLLQSTFNNGALMLNAKDLLDILVCPECKTPLRPPVDSANGLRCDTCRRIYPIRDEIPVLIIDQATKAPD